MPTQIATIGASAEKLSLLQYVIKELFSSTPIELVDLQPKKTGQLVINFTDEHETAPYAILLDFLGLNNKRPYHFLVYWDYAQELEFGATDIKEKNLLVPSMSLQLNRQNCNKFTKLAKKLSADKNLPIMVFESYKMDEILLAAQIKEILKLGEKHTYKAYEFSRHQDNLLIMNQEICDYIIPYFKREEDLGKNYINCGKLFYGENIVYQLNKKFANSGNKAKQALTMIIAIAKLVESQNPSLSDTIISTAADYYLPFHTNKHETPDLEHLLNHIAKEIVEIEKQIFAL